jgi:hypothetical protein
MRLVYLRNYLPRAAMLFEGSKRLREPADIEGALNARGDFRQL